tara:strand:+ start:1343 stop:1555 length:213 start_codon:yes stop_codon:yes gene_type:complete
MSTDIMQINITKVKETINQTSSSTSVSSSPSPRPLTPKTQDYCSKYLCYAPKIKKKVTKTTEEFKSFKLD